MGYSGCSVRQPVNGGLCRGSEWASAPPQIEVDEADSLRDLCGREQSPVTRIRDATRYSAESRRRPDLLIQPKGCFVTRPS